jgi:hypothetical protein
MMAFMFANALTAAPVVAAEGAAAMTAAEILAAEQAAQVLAAQTLAAEQAAALTAQQATAAAANTATATAANAATNQSILNAIGAGGAPTTAGGIGSIGAAGTGTGTGIMGAQTLTPAAAQTLTPAAAQTLTPATAAQTLTPAAETATLSQAELEAFRSGREIARLSSAAPPAEVTAYSGQGSMMNAPPADSSLSSLSPGNAAAQPVAPTVQAGVPSTTSAPSTVDLGQVTRYDPSQITTDAMRLGDHNVQAHELLKANPVPAPPAPPAESGFMKGISSAMDYMDKNPIKSAIGAYGLAKKTGMLDEEDQPEKGSYNGILSKYKMSPDFKGRQADPQDYQYTPKAYNMASGGIASYRRGGDLSSQLDYYEKMTQTKAPATDRGDPGIVYDTDPDTRSLDPVTAAQVRMAKVNKRANLQIPSMKRPTPMGQLNLVPVTMKKNDESPNTVDAAQGGVMSLGGYAAGGNPRLLKGPGDGMSDNIPATIAGKQPARLADGEFVIPADVVSHLGNGSTEAGAKKLHKMMNDVRKARTGNPKQGKQINPNKFMPK